MTPLFFHLLLSLVRGARHGYAMMREVEERTGGRVGIGPSSLYYSLGRLEEAGWIAETEAGEEESEAPHEERRRYYRLTGRGRARLEEETSALADIVSHARAEGVLR
jgi:DNA-binding PadR family transcriptional regulator